MHPRRTLQESKAVLSLEAGSPLRSALTPAMARPVHSTIVPSSSISHSEDRTEHPKAQSRNDDVALTGSGSLALTPTLATPPIHFIQLLRGIAPLLVLWAHLSGFWLYANERNWIVQDLWVQHFVLPFHLYQNSGHLGVVIFFLISGYIITHASTRETPFTFAFKRVFRIFPALFVALTVTLVSVRASGHFGLAPPPGASDGSPGAFVRNLFLIDGVTHTPSILAVTWTLTIEVLFYISIVVLMPLSKKKSVAATWWLILGYATAGSLVISFPLAAHMSTTVIYLAFLIAGRALYDWHRGFTSTYSTGAALATVALLFLCFYTAAFPGQLLIDGVEPAVSYCIAILLFIGLMRAPLRRTIRPFNFFADISYSLYLLHIPVGMFAINLMISKGAPFTFAFSVGCASSIAAAAASYRWIESPCQRLARRALRSIGKSRGPIDGTGAPGSWG